MGHNVKLMPSAYMKPYVKRNKTDAADAQAIAEAVTRPTMRFVAVKSADQQAMLMLHRVRELLVRQRTMLATALRAHLAEFGIVAPQGIHRVEKLAAEVHDPAVPQLAREVLMLLVDELASVRQRIETLEKRLVALHRADASVGISPQSPASAPSPRWRSSAPCLIPQCSALAASLPHGSASRPETARVEVRTSSGEFPSAATGTSVICSMSAATPSASLRHVPRRAKRGSKACRSAVRRRLSSSRSPTRWRGSLGP